MEIINYSINRSSVEGMGYNFMIFYISVLHCFEKWNKAFYDIADFRYHYPSNITIKFGEVDRKNDTKEDYRIAECRDRIGKSWEIILACDLDWNISNTQLKTNLKRLLGIGEDIEKALMHEIGHIFDLPHSHHPKDVMNKNAPSKNFSKQEIEDYRNYFLKNVFE